MGQHELYLLLKWLQQSRHVTAGPQPPAAQERPAPWLQSSAQRRPLVLARLTSAPGSWDQQALHQRAHLPDPQLTEREEPVLSTWASIALADRHRDPQAPSPLLCLLLPPPPRLLPSFSCPFLLLTTRALTALHSRASWRQSGSCIFSPRPAASWYARGSWGRGDKTPHGRCCCRSGETPRPPLHQSPHRPSSGTAKGRRPRRQVRRSPET